MTDSQQPEIPRWAVALFGAALTLLWPLLLGHRGAPFEGFHRRELVMIGVGMVIWGAVGWTILGSGVGVILPEVIRV